MVKYYVYVEDYSGCIVGDTVEIVDQDQDTYYVSTTGSNSNSGTVKSDALSTVAAALELACVNDTIIILDGTYTEDSIFVTKPVIIGSEYIIDNDPAHISNTVFENGDDGVFFYNYVNSIESDTTSSQIAGFTIRNSNNPNTDQWYGHGGAISVWNSVVKINHMRILNNTARDGGGLGFMGHGFTAVVANSVVSENSATEAGGGIRAQLTGSLWIRNTSIDNNTAINGGGGLATSSLTYLNDVVIEDNVAQSGGGFTSSTIGQGGSTSHKWSNVTVRNNSASGSYGAGVFYKNNGSAHFTLENALIVDNTSNQYPGLTFQGYDGNRISLVNSTIYNNLGSSSSAEGKNNIAIWDNTIVRLLNTIVGRSGGSSGYTFYGNNCGTQYLLADESSVIEGGATSIYDYPCGSNETVTSLTGIVTTGVYFADPTGGDYSLKSVNTILGAGLSTNNLSLSSSSITGMLLTAPLSDIYGNLRPNPVGSNSDIGAIESPDSSAQVGIALVSENNGFCETASGSITANLLNYTGGTATYAWSSTTYPSWTWNATQTAISLASGDYKVVAKDATSGAKIDSLEITIATLPSISIVNTSTDVTCFSDDDGELTFEIYGGNPLGGSQYTYSVDYLETMAQATGVVIDGSYFDEDNQSSARTNKYVSDNWNGNPNYQGKYYVSVSDEDGCTFTDTLEIGFDHALPEVSITTLASDGTVGLTSMCEGTGNTINLTAGVTGGGGTNTYSWSNASTAATVGVALTDSYVLEVTDQFTCVGKDTLDVYFQAAPQIGLY